MRIQLEPSRFGVCCHIRSTTNDGMQLSLLLLLASGPHLGAARGPGKPEGRRARCAPFSYGTGMCLTKIPGPLADPALCAGRAAWGVFLCLLSLHKQRK